jgi:hypothetical protein
MTMGFDSDPSSSSLTSLEGKSPAFRHVAWRAKQARCGANDGHVESVEMEELDEDREEREVSETMDSGLDP